MPPQNHTSQISKALPVKAHTVYTPLTPDCTRVLVLSPGQPDEPLKAELETVSFTDLEAAAQHECCIVQDRDVSLPKIGDENIGLGVPLFYHPARSHTRFGNTNDTEEQEGVGQAGRSEKCHYDLSTWIECHQARKILARGYGYISYAWGERVFPHCIEVAVKQLQLTSSLYEALKRFRKVDRPRRLWADALCINQADAEERAQQVAVIADIFAAASTVLVWLGPACERDILAFATIPKVPDTPGTGWTDRLCALLSDSPYCVCCGDTFEPSPNIVSDCMEACALLLERS